MIIHIHEAPGTTGDKSVLDKLNEHTQNFNEVVEFVKPMQTALQTLNDTLGAVKATVQQLATRLDALEGRDAGTFASAGGGSDTDLTGSVTMEDERDFPRD